ncbi:MAG: hypothetical protein LBN33_00105 [Desulfovibrio sp.]|jgi:hypothetical protein|nr:hypothetical protein [Desulfovibrio sp.]
MSAQRVAATPRSQIQSLAYHGIRVAENYHQIKELVRTRLGDSYALLFAEPGALDGSSQTIDWYTPVQGPVRRVTELQEDEAQKIFAIVRQMGQGIKRLAEELKNSGIQQQIVRGAILEMALCYPDISHVYAVGGQPVLTCWGFSLGTVGAQPEDLARFGDGFVAKARPAATEEKAYPLAPPTNGAGFLRWLLPLFFLLLLLSVLFIPFGTWEPFVRIPGLDFRLPALPGAATLPPDDSSGKLKVEEKQLREDIEALRSRLEQEAALCEPSPAKTVEAPRQELVIPEKSEDYRFLEGRWINDAGLVSKEDGSAITVIYSFDAKGEGTATVGRKDGDCVGKARAFFTDGGILRIESERQVCPSGNRSYAAEIIECKPASGGRASCLGKSASGATWGGSVSFHRIP